MDRHFFSGLGIAPDPRGFLADTERTERGDFHRLALNERIGHVLQDAFDQLGTFVPAKANFSENGFTEIHAGQCFLAHPVPRSVYGHHNERGYFPSQYQGFAKCR